MALIRNVAVVGGVVVVHTLRSVFLEFHRQREGRGPSRGVASLCGMLLRILHGRVLWSIQHAGTPLPPMVVVFVVCFAHPLEIKECGSRAPLDLFLVFYQRG